jgi:hypothetical protein
MNPGMREKFCALMRVAYSRACVAFPKVDPNPIAVALWQVYAGVAYELGSTYPLGAPIIKEEIFKFTLMAKSQILARAELATATAGMSSQDSRQFAQIGLGLDQATAMHLFRYRQQYRKDFMGISTMRLTALQSRRNSLANQMVDVAAQQARITMNQIERGDGISQTSRPTMSM